MPRGVYDRTKMSKPQAAGEARAKKAVPAKRARPRLHSLPRPASAQTQAGWEASNPVPAAPVPELKTFYVTGSANGISVFDALPHAIQHQVDSTGKTALELAQDPAFAILEIQATEKPEPKNIRLSFTL